MTPRSTSDSELEVLKALWEAGPATVRELHERLAGRGLDWAYTTVQTLLLRLRQKGYARCDERGRAHVFAATRSMEELLREELDKIAQRVCEGAATPLVLTLVKERRFSREEIRELRLLLEKLEAEGASSEKKAAKRPRAKTRGKKSRG